MSLGDLFPQLGKISPSNRNIERKGGTNSGGGGKFWTEKNQALIIGFLGEGASKDQAAYLAKVPKVTVDGWLSTGELDTRIYENSSEEEEELSDYAVFYLACLEAKAVHDHGWGRKLEALLEKNPRMWIAYMEYKKNTDTDFSRANIQPEVRHKVVVEFAGGADLKKVRAMPQDEGDVLEGVFTDAPLAIESGE